MSFDTRTTHVTPAGGNIFSDLGFGPEDAARLLAETDKVLSEKLVIKELMITEIAGWIVESNLKQMMAAEILGVTCQRVDDAINKKSSKFTIDELVDMLEKTGKHIQLSIR
jgi:predicted XRE-type DNA-binding protein